MGNVKKILLMMYKNPDIISRIDDIACKHCSLRDACPAEDNGVCPQTDEEAIDLFIKYGLKELKGENNETD